jgi:glutamate carboxypeptidase
MQNFGIDKFILQGAMALSLGLHGYAWAAAPIDKQVQEHAMQSTPAVLGLMEKLVNIDSGTSSEKGLDQVGAIVAEEARKLGMQVEFSPAAPPAVGKNIVATFKGNGRAKILLMTHMDTVFADGTAAARPFRVQGDRAYGPGVMDDKGGIAMALQAIRILQQTKFSNFAHVTLLVNTNEETFSKGSRSLIESLSRQHDVVLSMEPGRAADGVVVWRKGSADLAIEVKGKAAHAGVAPESGRNAAMEAAHQMLQMSKLGDPAKLTTVNFTVIKAGDRPNVIPDAARVQGDMRATQADEFDRVEKDMARIAEKKLIAGTEVKTSLTRGMAPMPVNPRTDALAARAQAIYAELGMKLGLEGSGGAADANYAAALGVPTIDGFGIVGGGIHTDEEYAEIKSIPPRLYLLVRMIMELAAKP